MKKICRFALTGILTLTLAFAPWGQNAAADDSRQSLEDCLAEVKQQIDSTNKALDQIYVRSAEINEKIVANEVLIATLEESLALQKADMAARIKYMYEAGTSVNVLAVILSSDTLADALNRAAYVSEIVGYDREKLNEYARTIQQIETSQAELEAERNELAELRNSISETNAAYTLEMAALTEKIVALDIEEAEAARLIEEYMAANAASAEPQTEQPGGSAMTEPMEEPVTEPAADPGIEEPATEPAADGPTEPAEEPEPAEPADPVEPAEPVEEPTEPADPGRIVPIDTYSFTEEEIYDLARITYLEDGCSYPVASYTSVYLVACVILNRAINWYGGSIHDAIYAPGQYSTAYRYTNWGGGELVINEATWIAVNDALTNLDPNPYFQCNGDLFSDTGLEIYYRDPVTDEVFYYDY